ncbi:hypothetical protein B4098_1129 [Heyndrickxia coagulans]|uniref:Uncharacterized protein n=1 Tax=Heyndrickxia coagulans TaxID=1398 RepID=A0A150JRI4_HEYCO|nr:hypothetical protein B4098_1129 [Heyndrickxia coagulans]
MGKNGTRWISKQLPRIRVCRIRYDVKAEKTTAGRIQILKESRGCA